MISTSDARDSDEIGQSYIFLSAICEFIQVQNIYPD